MTKKTNYLSNKELKRMLKESNEQGKPTDELCQAFFLLTNRIAGRANFGGFSYIEDMKAEGLFCLARGWDKIGYDENANPFSYMTTIVYNAFRSVLNDEHKQSMTLDLMKIEEGLDPSENFESYYDAMQKRKEKTKAKPNTSLSTKIVKEIRHRF